MTDEHAHGERETDDIEDAQTPISEEEIMYTIKRVSKQIEALDDEQPTAD